jgi:molecular chaperone GrpE
MSEENGSTQNNSVEPKVDNTELLKQEAEKYKNDFLYLRAEFENYKRNSIKERSDLLKYGAERVIREILDVVDNFDRALQIQVNTDNLNQFVQGVRMTAQELKQVLQKSGVQEVPSEAVPFNPSQHEALGSEPTDKVPAGHIFRVHKKAYKLHEKLIRPAQVIVAAALPSAEKNESST